MTDPANPGAPSAPATTPAAPAAAPTAPPVAASPPAPVTAAPAAPVAAPAAPPVAPPADTKYLNPHARIARAAAQGGGTVAQAAVLGEQYKTAQATIAQQTEAAKLHADATLATIPENMRAVVMKYAGADPFKQLERIAFLRESGALNPVLAAPGNTAPAAPPPAPGLSNDADIAAYLEWKTANDGGHDLVAAHLRRTKGPAIAAGAQKHASKN